MVKADESGKQTISFFIEMIIWCNSVSSKNCSLLYHPALSIDYQWWYHTPHVAKGFAGGH